MDDWEIEEVPKDTSTKEQKEGGNGGSFLGVTKIISDGRNLR